VARFEAERQALATMHHANTAKVFDGGATDSSRPFFVTELVTGEPILRESLAETGRFDEAEKLLQSAAARRSGPDADAAVRRQTAERLVALYDKWGKTAEAAAARETLAGLGE
jgi:hypothetical protein